MTADTTLTRERRKRRALGLLAGAAGGLLLLGGTTFALWTASDTQAGGTITAGTFSIADAGTPTYWDTSTGRTDATATNPITGAGAHSITDAATYRIVPGDTLQANYPFLATMTGDNLVATVQADLADGSTTATKVSFAAQAYYWNGTVWTAVGSPTAIVLGTATPVSIGTFQAPLTGQDTGLTEGTTPLPILDGAVATGTPSANLAVVLTATFDPATTGTVDATIASALGNLSVSINQTRTSGVGNFS